MRLTTVQEPVPSSIDRVEQMFQAHHRLVFRTAYRITGNATDAEDVLQTVFLRLVGREASAEPLENPESYLRRAAVNAALDVMRARATAQTAELVETASPHNEIEGSELRDGLRRALASLHPHAAEVFALRFLEGYDNREIARMLGISTVHVAVILHRARRRLQREIRSQIGGHR